MFKRLISLLFLVLLLSNCVFEDRSDCLPAMPTSLRLHVNYPQGQNADESALPIVRADFYIFDVQQRFVCCVSDETGPFNAGYQCTVNLSAGQYSVVLWGNKTKQYVCMPEPFIAGQTRLGDARLLLGPLANRLNVDFETSVSGPSMPLYHAIEQDIIVEEGKVTDVTLPLYRNTKTIRFAVRFQTKDGTLCEDLSHKYNVILRSADGVLGFDNSVLAGSTFDYTPTPEDDSIAEGFDAAFHKMTLRTDEAEISEILLTRKATVQSGTPEVFYRESLMKLLAGTGYSSQQALDRTHVYDIELCFTCGHGDGGTNTTVRIWVNGWEYVDFDEEV